MNGFDLSTISKVYYGSHECTAIYYGSTKIWPSYTPIPVGTIFNFAYTGTVQSQELVPGTYKLQVWGAQGGSVSGTYTAAGSKGGYSEGILTLDEPTTLYIFVGGKGADASTSTTTSGTVNGGWNGGGGSVRYSTYSSGGTVGASYPRPGGGATDIATVTSDMSYSSYRTNRSSASLNSRLLVAGGGAGASARVTTVSGTISVTGTLTNSNYLDGSYELTDRILSYTQYEKNYFRGSDGTLVSNANFDVYTYEVTAGSKYVFNLNYNTYGDTYACAWYDSNRNWISTETSYYGHLGYTSNWVNQEITAPAGAAYLYINRQRGFSSQSVYGVVSSSVVNVSNSSYKYYKFAVTSGTTYTVSAPSITSPNGGTNYHPIIFGSNISGGTISSYFFNSHTTFDGAFSGTITSPSGYGYMYIVVGSSDSTPTVTYSGTTTESSITSGSEVGGGTSGGGTLPGTQSSAGTNGGLGYGGNSTASGYRYVSGGGGGGYYGGGSDKSDSTASYISRTGGGSGYVDNSLDSGSTTAGSSSFPSTSGSTETGHSGDGYARITCIDPNSLIPLTFDILGSGTIGWKASNSSLTRTIQYKKNNGSWNNITSSTSGVTISVSTGDVVQFRGSSTAFASSGYYNFFTATCNFNVRGNIMSMFSNSGFESITTIPASYALKGLFYGNTYLKDASALLMPATTLTTYCYQNMFYGCTNMTGVPALPATTTQGRCYYRMFYNCVNITTAPVLNAATVATYGYYQMFYGCSKLNYIKCLATSISASNAVNGWVNGVAASGTFVKASSMSSWTTGTSGIPSGWTVQNA